MPKRYKAYALLGLFIESLVLTLHNPFFSLIEATSNAEAILNNIYIPINILCIASCILLLRNKLLGLKMARFALIILMAILIIDLIFGISYVELLDYFIGIIEILIYGFFLRYWMKKEHLAFLSN
ncbi:MAG: hypothetical protein CBE24_06430 [bacterium TMED264]|nr:MAG: hypothetical protein CBE24_06430 [bacterium TMED264]|tara:strand:+ start:127 stop:501 length:375 start_codon:yes stop_codon:yes gene_type:complete